MKKVIYICVEIDFESGEAVVMPLPSELDGQTRLFKADVLSDIIGQLDETYRETVHTMWGGDDAERQKLS